MHSILLVSWTATTVRFASTLSPATRRWIGAGNAVTMYTRSASPNGRPRRRAQLPVCYAGSCGIRVLRDVTGVTLCITAVLILMKLIALIFFGVIQVTVRNLIGVALIIVARHFTYNFLIFSYCVCYFYVFVKLYRITYLSGNAWPNICHVANSKIW